MPADRGEEDLDLFLGLQVDGAQGDFDTQSRISYVFDRLARATGGRYEIVLSAMGTDDALRKLDPRLQVRNPVMFVVEVGSVLTTLIWLRDLVGRTLGARPFERTWMADYVDRRMEIDAGRTRARLAWSPTPRLSLLTRLPFLIEHRRENPLEWYRRNREALEHLKLTPNFRIYRLMKRYEEQIEQELGDALRRRPRAAAAHQERTPEQQLRDHRVTIRNLLASVRTGDNEPFVSWCGDLAQRLAAEGLDAEKLILALGSLDSITVDTLRADPEGATLAPAGDIVDGSGKVLGLHNGNLECRNYESQGWCCRVPPCV